MGIEKNRKEANRWLRTADDDLDSAIILKNNKKFAHSCFHAQQAEENRPLCPPAIQDLAPIFRRKKRIAAVYVFGSAATGRNRRGSDLDLAIVVKRTMSSRERLRLEVDLSSRLRQDVDLIVFGQAKPLLQHQILKYGRLICENDPGERIRQEVRARAEYLDTRHLFRELE